MRKVSIAIIVTLISVAASVGVLVYSLQHPQKSQKPTPWWAWILVIAIAILSALAPIGWNMIRSRVRRRGLSARTSTVASDLDFNEDKESSQLASGPYRSSEEYRLALYRKQSNEAENELVKYLPSNPRRAKQLINHQRLYARIAEDRKVFGGKPELTHHHLAKWVLIVEEWPRLGAVLTHDPSKMSALEESSTLDGLQKSIDNSAPGIRATDELLQILHNEITISPILARLVRFEAAPSASASGQHFSSTMQSDV